MKFNIQICLRNTKKPLVFMFFPPSSKVRHFYESPSCKMAHQKGKENFIGLRKISYMVRYALKTIPDKEIRCYKLLNGRNNQIHYLYFSIFSFAIRHVPFSLLSSFVYNQIVLTKQKCN